MDGEGGEFRKSVCESTEAAERLLLRSASASCVGEDESAGGDGREAGLCGGSDAMVERRCCGGYEGFRLKVRRRSMFHVAMVVDGPG